MQPDLHLDKHLAAIVRWSTPPGQTPPEPVSLVTHQLWCLYGAAVHQAESRGPDLTIVEPAKNGKSIARVQIRGTMLDGRSYWGTSTPDITQAVSRAANDPNISGIMLEINSPGGQSAGVEALGSTIADARRKKPVWASIEGVGASAAYWAASQADMVYAVNKSSFVGSIGTYLSFYDSSKAAKDAGVEAVVFATGSLKGAGMTDGSPLTEEQRTYFQGLVNAIQGSFDSAVKSGRSLNQTQLNAVKSGAVFPASEAVGLRLIDGIQPASKTLAGLMAAK